MPVITTMNSYSPHSVYVFAPDYGNVGTLGGRLKYESRDAIYGPPNMCKCKQLCASEAQYTCDNVALVRFLRFLRTDKFLHQNRIWQNLECMTAGRSGWPVFGQFGEADMILRPMHMLLRAVQCRY